MAKPNYSYQKRQKELAKQKKRDEKLKKKQEKKGTDEDDANSAVNPVQESSDERR